MMRRFLEGQRQPWWYSLFAIVVSVLLVAGGGVAYVSKKTRAAVEESERKNCKLVIIIDDYFQKAPLPPAVDDAQARARRDYAAAVHQQRKDFHCDEKR